MVSLRKTQNAHKNGAKSHGPKPNAEIRNEPNPISEQSQRSISRTPAHNDKRTTTNDERKFQENNSVVATLDSQTPFDAPNGDRDLERREVL